jgi:hypothetical protein
MIHFHGYNFSKTRTAVKPQILATKRKTAPCQVATVATALDKNGFVQF